MPVQNREIADKFEVLADLLDIEGANPFRVRAYRNAAQRVRDHPTSMADLLDNDETLSDLPGIGEDLAEKIETMVDTGELPLLRDVQARTPRALSELMKIDGLGPKRVKSLNQALDINSLDDLKQAIEQHRVRNISGFGEKTEASIKRRLDAITDQEQRSKRIDAEQVAAPLLDWLKQCKGIKDITIAGSYRRCKETVGDLDILVTAKRGTDIIDHFTHYEDVDEVVSSGKTRSTVRLRSGLSVDLRVVPQVAYGAALHYFTGSKSHNIAVRRRAVKRGYKINEYGVFEDGKRIAGKTERSVYRSVGLKEVPPELRENRGEIEAAENDTLPRLVTLDDIRGDLHSHTEATDGHYDIRSMVDAARERGYAYFSITDHSHNLSVANGLNEKRLREQLAAIDELNDSLDDIVILKAIEVDILRDGRLDLPDSVLAELDFTLAAVHDHFDLSPQQQTRRILRAMDNPHFSILAHPTGRMINKRPAYKVDLEAVMDGARERGCFLELNANPARLDLTDQACQMAKDKEIKIAISTDAHSVESLGLMRFGVDQARRGWLEAGDVLNTLSLRQLKKHFER